MTTKEKKMSKVRLSFGEDPELMLVSRDGHYKSAIPIINADKEHKLSIGNHNLFYDNVLAEMNVKPGYSKGEVVANLGDCLRQVAKVIHPFRLKVQASQTYPAAECKHKDALVFGCEAEFCSYEMAQLSPPTCEPGNCFRSAGGHIHLGYSGEAYPLLAPIKNPGTEDEDRMDRDWGRVWVVRMLDLFVGIPALFVDHDPTSRERRKLYGGAGTHRPKENYGVEYRAISNFWLQSPKLTSLVYDLAAYTVNFVARQGHLELWKNEQECKYNTDELRRTINQSDHKSARKFMEEIVKKYIPADLYTTIFQLAEPVQYNFYREWGIA